MVKFTTAMIETTSSAFGRGLSTIISQLLDDPNDGDSFRSAFFRKYEKVQSDMNDNIVMLYDKDKVSAQKQRDLKPNFQYLNPDNIIIPNIEVLSPLPIQTHIALTRNLPVLKGGDFKFPIPELMKLMNSSNKSIFSDLLRKDATYVP
ncbi:hypothetical protein CHS0354_025941 [Potamilus streckersoni]|uniref:Uncharacterized protein n=1 Tax=Potamilus streckersoni TaxID=2493646 RepID=A0AAE0T4I1_9BIVA|nr:hypothetical protein CHS0354_025941 [Potamilus streckersoni]